MSRQADLEQLIALGEGYTLEFKRSGTSHLGRELCAFANASGGHILMDVEEPCFEIDENWFIITFPRPVKARTGEPAQVEDQERLELRLELRLESNLAARVLVFLQSAELGRAQIATKLGHRRISGELNKQIKRLLEMELIERTLPDKPTSRLQKYRLTEKGRAWLQGHQD